MSGEACLATKATDVWSIGMVLFWLLTGQVGLPFFRVGSRLSQQPPVPQTPWTNAKTPTKGPTPLSSNRFLFARNPGPLAYRLDRSRKRSICAASRCGCALKLGPRFYLFG